LPGNGRPRCGRLPPRRRRCSEECVFLSRDIGEWRVAIALTELGKVSHSQGDLEAARSTLLKALEGQRELGDKPGIAETLIALAAVSHDAGDVASEREHLRAALDIVPTGDKLSQVTWLEPSPAFSAQMVMRDVRGTPLGLYAACTGADRFSDIDSGTRARKSTWWLPRAPPCATSGI
jgi:hypothetical protein